MEDCFVIYYDRTLLVILKNLKGVPHPNSREVLDWYAKNYAFERSRLTGQYTYSIDVHDMKYEDFQEKKDETQRTT